MFPCTSEHITPWNSEEGKSRLFKSKYVKSFFVLAHLFERQIKPTYCGVASAVMVLNALRRDKKGLKLEDKLDVKMPDNGDRLKFNYYSQLTLLDRRAQKIKKKSAIEGKPTAKSGFNPGMTLEDLGKILRLHHLDIKVHHPKKFSQSGLERFRQDVMSDGSSLSSFIIANFDGSEFGREGEGHFSPLAGYHSESDSCLVMDTNGCRQPWFWVPLEIFFRSMCTADGKHHRGYMVVYDKLDN